ncbi:MAG: peptide deformylase [Verrucomicrobiota bacterium]
MVREIVLFGHKALRAKCTRVNDVDDGIRELADDMIETMREAHGVGLAAPQVAVTIQLAVVDVSHDPDCISYLRVDGTDTALEDLMPLVFTNPEIEPAAKKVASVEGCLSFPDLQGDVPRPEAIVAKLTLLDGKTITVETDGLLARAILHETDHLNGILFIDRMSTVSKARLKNSIKQLQAESIRAKRR